MLLSSVKSEHLIRLKKEMAANPKRFSRDILIRAKVENPHYAVLVECLGQLAEIEFREKGHVCPEDARELALDVGALCFRALELAGKDGIQLSPAERKKNALMQDPDANTGPSGVAAGDEARALMKKLLAARGPKKDE